MQINDIISMGSAVLAPNLEIIGGGGVGGVIQTLRKVGGRSPKKFFPTLWASVWSKNKGGARAPRPLPWIRHCSVKYSLLDNINNAGIRLGSFLASKVKNHSSHTCHVTCGQDIEHKTVWKKEHMQYTCIKLVLTYISRKLKTNEFDVMTEDYHVNCSEVKLYGKGLKLKQFLEKSRTFI